MAGTGALIFIEMRHVKPAVDHLKHPLGLFYSDPGYRLLSYLLQGLFILCEVVLGLAIYKGPAFLVGRMTFVCTYALHMTLMFIPCQLLVDILAHKSGFSLASYKK